jgi:hypothetical protein
MKSIQILSISEQTDFGITEDCIGYNDTVASFYSRKVILLASDKLLDFQSVSFRYMFSILILRCKRGTPKYFSRSSVLAKPLL